MIENQLQNIQEVEMGTLLKISDQLILVAQTSLTAERLAKKVEDIPFNQIKIINEIPRDPRHHSKIAYKKLEELIL